MFAHKSQDARKLLCLKPVIAGNRYIFEPNLGTAIALINMNVRRLAGFMTIEEKDKAMASQDCGHWPPYSPPLTPPLGRRPGGREEADPVGDVEARQRGFRHRRQLGRGRGAHRAAGRERPQLAGLGVRQHRRHGGEEERRLPCEEIGDGG